MNKYELKIRVVDYAKKIMGDAFVENRYFKRCAQTYLKKQLVFVHIPKAAGSSISNSIYGKRNGHYTYNEILNSGLSVSASLSTLPSFSVVRHPVSRLLSSYRYARNGGGSDGGIFPDQGYKSDSFSSFSKFINEWLVEQDLDSVDRVFMPQSRFVMSDVKGCESSQYRELDFIGKVEEMHEVKRWLQETLGEEIHIPHKNVTDKSDDEAALISALDLEIVRSLYKADFEMFDYK